MTRQDAIKKLIEVALAEEGYLEKATNANLDSKTANAGYDPLQFTPHVPRFCAVCTRDRPVSARALDIQNSRISVLVAETLDI